MNQELPKIYTVSALTREIRERLETHFPLVWVSGEVSNLRQPVSGHLYFTLKDAGAQLRAVFFKGNHLHQRYKPAEGGQVLCRGRITVYEARGDYQLIVDYMEPLGLGALAQAFEALKARLAAEGLFDAARKKPLPFLPRRLALVTSPTGAVVRDFLRLLKRRFAHVEVLVYPVKVQGAEAAGEIVQALDDLGAYPGVEVIVLARGGGSLEDLWPFNEEIVARAIERSPIPVVSAIGHEVESVTFILALRLEFFQDFWTIIVGLLIGGAIAAPLAAVVTKRLPTRALMVLVGVLIIILSIRTIVLALA